MNDPPFIRKGLHSHHLNKINLESDNSIHISTVDLLFGIPFSKFKYKVCNANSEDLSQRRESEPIIATITDEESAAIKFFYDGAVNKTRNRIGLGGMTYHLEGHVLARYAKISRREILL